MISAYNAVSKIMAHYCQVVAPYPMLFITALSNIKTKPPIAVPIVITPPYLQRLNIMHIAAVQNITTLQIFRSFAYHHAKNKLMNIHTANNVFNENIISNPPLKSVS